MKNGISKETALKIKNYLASTPPKSVIYLPDVKDALGVRRQRVHQLLPFIAQFAQESGRSLATPQEAKKRAAIERGKTQREKTDAAVVEYLHREDLSQAEIAKQTELSPRTILRSMQRQDVRRGTQSPGSIARREATMRQRGTKKKPKPKQTEQHIKKRMESTAETYRRLGKIRGRRKRS